MRRLVGAQFTRFLSVFLVAAPLQLGATTTATSQANDTLAVERQHYHDALRALGERRWDEFSHLRQNLDAYPLAIYLDYYQLKRNLHNVSPEQASNFLQRSADTPLPNRFLSAYLDHAGKRQRWTDFLDVMPEEPSSTVLKCYYFRAQLAAGNHETAWEGAAALWQHGRSQPDECDPLFTAWEKAGELKDEHVWARMLAAFDEKQPRLMKYIARKGSSELQPWIEKLRGVYARPQSLQNLKLAADDQRSADIAAHGLVYLARYSPEQALATWKAQQNTLPFTPQQVNKVEYAIAQRSLFARTEAHIGWLHGALGRLADDKLTGIRLRWALRERDWLALERSLPLLSEAGQEKTVWRYWKAVAMAKRGAADASLALFQAIASERDYYGFLAADRLGTDYRFNPRALPPLTESEFAQTSALRRIEELQFHDEHNLAHSEWYKVLSGSASAEEKEKLARLASERGWYRMAIDAASKAKAWDALDVRFPLAYQSVFNHHAQSQQVPSTELMAISRRESAFYPQARSPVGARGLMQIMPATGRQVAASLNSPHRTSNLFEVEHNVMLGSTYYRQLLERFDGNRIFALAAYNAGPHRVDRWRNDPTQALPADIWVETIPFRETRNYVQAVLAYNVVFKYMMGEDTLSLMTTDEKQRSY